MKFKIDWRILLVITVAVIATTMAIGMNSIQKEENAETLAGYLDKDDGDLKINWNRYSTVNMDLTESVNITNSGTYIMTGEIDDGLITINAGDGEIKLILNNVSVTNSTGPAIACYSAEDLVIELVGDNYLEDGASYHTDYDEDVTGAIYSKSDLTFTGDGSLEIIANYADAIVSKDDLKFNGGKYNIKSTDDGIRGKDSVYIVNGDFVIESGADAVKSTNETVVGKGFVLIENGNFSIKSSAKGIKAINSVVIYNGSFLLNTYDDSIHSDNYVGIIDGDIYISAGDDAVHADKELVIDGGKIIVAKSYEGLEAQVVTINGGNINLTTLDDGINAGGGADSSATSRPGAGPFDADETCILSINGGELYINASGDGVDSNGWLYFNDGTVVVDGPTNNGNGALDSGMGIVMNGGEVIAIGASGMASSLGSSSTINNVSIYLNTMAPSDTLIEIKDASGNTIIEHTSAKTFNHIAVGSSKFQLGNTYSLYLDGEHYQTFTISNITTTVGGSYNQQNSQNQQRQMGPPSNRQ